MSSETKDHTKGIALKTQKFDLWRNTCNGIVEASFASACLLVAIRYFGATDTAKSLLAGGSSIGFLITPAFLLLIGRSKLPVSILCAILLFFVALCILASAAATSAWFYVGCVLLGCVIAAQVPSLMVHVYANNYKSNERGRKISSNLMLSAVVGSVTALLVGFILDEDLSYFRIGAVVTFLFCLGTAYFHLKIPSKPLNSESRGLSKDLAYAIKDRLFFWMLTGWMLMGIGNLVTIPLRVEYLANPVHGLNLSNTMILSITMVIPLICRICSTPLWGWAFDKFNLALVRISINLFFLLGLFLYFQTKDIILLSFASALIGTATGGGTMAWTLWVTKIAPKGAESSYMSVHSFFTGVRGVPAPFLGYWILTNLGPVQVSWTSATLISLSCLIFIKLASDERLKPNYSPIARKS